LGSHSHFIPGNFKGTSPKKKPKPTSYGPSWKILLLLFDGFVPQIDCPKAVTNINSILTTFPSGIRAQVMEPIYSAYGISLTCVPTPAKIG
jgi:hypothetical protein